MFGFWITVLSHSILREEMGRKRPGRERQKDSKLDG